MSVSPKIVMTAALLFGVVYSTPSAAQEPILSFSMQQGINIAGPFVRVKITPPNPNGQISAFWGMHMYPGWYTGEELRQVGFDFIRLPVNPAPLLENPPAVQRRLLDEIEDGMRRYLSAGLSVVLDLHFWSPPNKTWTADAVLYGGPSAFTAYLALVEEIALRLARYPHGKVAFELFNEPFNHPPHESCERSSWLLQQRALLKGVRRRAPILPVLVTSCGDYLDGLKALNNSNLDWKDKNLIFTFHFYEPFLFTHQGYPNNPYVVGVPYPASAGSLTATLDITNREIDSAGLSAIDTLTTKARAANDVAQYFAQAPGQSFIEKRFDTLMALAKANGISPSRILLGEFAALNLRKTDTPDNLASRVRWDEDVKAAAAKRGIAWAYWTLPYPKGPIFR